MIVVVWILVIYGTNDGSGVTFVDNIATAQSCAIARDLVNRNGSYYTKPAICVPVRRRATEAAS